MMQELTMKDWLDDTRKKVKEGNCPLEFIPVDLYEYAVRTGIISPTNKEKWNYLRRAVEYREFFYRDRAKDKEGHKQYQIFMSMKAAGCFEGEEVNRLKNLSKKMILWDYLSQ